MLSRSLTNYRDAISINYNLREPTQNRHGGVVSARRQLSPKARGFIQNHAITSPNGTQRFNNFVRHKRQLYIAIYYMIGNGQFALLWTHQIFKSQIKLTTDACKARHLNRRRRAFIWINRNTGWSWYIQKTEVPDKWRNGYHIFCGHYWICLLQDVETITSNFGICSSETLNWSIK